MKETEKNMIEKFFSVPIYFFLLQFLFNIQILGKYNTLTLWIEDIRFYSLNMHYIFPFKCIEFFFEFDIAIKTLTNFVSFGRMMSNLQQVLLSPRIFRRSVFTVIKQSSILVFLDPALNYKFSSNENCQF